MLGESCYLPISAPALNAWSSRLDAHGLCFLSVCRCSTAICRQPAFIVELCTRSLRREPPTIWQPLPCSLPPASPLASQGRYSGAYAAATSSRPASHLWAYIPTVSSLPRRGARPMFFPRWRRACARWVSPPWSERSTASGSLLHAACSWRPCGRASWPSSSAAGDRRLARSPRPLQHAGG